MRHILPPTFVLLTLQRFEDAEERNELVRRARARVDQARELVKRLEREIAALAWNAERNQIALARFERELGEARDALRERQRELIRCIG